LWNGSLGKIENVLDLNGRPSLLCWLDGTRHEIREENFHRIDLADAITVHKAQGPVQESDYAVCREPLARPHSDLHRPERGMEQIVFIGDRNTFDAAVIAPPGSQERQVGFSV
jgi:hypothetical protein